MRQREEGEEREREQATCEGRETVFRAIGGKHCTIFITDKGLRTHLVSIQKQSKWSICNIQELL